MRRDEALALLGLGADHDVEARRAAYRDAARRTHPDRPGAPSDATDRMAALNLAYAILNGTERPDPEWPAAAGAAGAAGAKPGGDGPSPPVRTAAGPGRWAVGEPLAVQRDEDGSLLVDAPAEETFDALVEAMERIGDLTYVDAEAGLVQMLARHLDGPICSVTCSLQGRATGTEVFTTIERLDTVAAPDPADTAALLSRLADTLGGG